MLQFHFPDILTSTLPLFFLTHVCEVLFLRRLARARTPLARETRFLIPLVAPALEAQLPSQLTDQIGQREHVTYQVKFDPNARAFDDDTPKNYRPPSLDE